MVSLLNFQQGHMEKKHLYLFILIVQYSLASTDEEAILDFQNHITSPTPFLAKNWTMNTSYCSWLGVTCSLNRQRIVALSLPNLQLQGTISPSLANLSFLRELNLRNNKFHGGIPYGLFQHRRLQIISLSYNQLTGEIWKGPWYVPQLKVLDISNNSLSGIIPPSIGNATKLFNLSLYGNRINGNIPKEIGNLSQLAGLSLFDNQLTGSMPVSLFNITSLLTLHVKYNSLSGPILLGDGNIFSNLELLSISDNKLSGHIPSNICQLTKLKILSLSFNNITGEIPKNIGCLSKLEEMYIGFNEIDGTIPSSLGNLSALIHLDCPDNHMEGFIPPELGKLSNLRNLGLDQNYNLIGQIPEAIFNISSLEVIALAFNNLTGKLPATTGLHLPNLRGVYLASNRLKGEIPPYFTNASKLDTLELAANFFTGTIPTNLGDFRELQVLGLWKNQLINEPGEHELKFLHSLVNCRMLQYVGVNSNPLNGILPNAIGNLSSTIENFHIANAQISGIIPPGIGNMSGLIDLDFEENNLMGSIPSEIGNIKQLQGLFLTNNKLQGHIPEVVCQVSNLVELSLAYNELSGIIPKCIDNLGMLKKLFLGSNKFSSKLPSSLWKMTGLLYLDMSLNLIQGEVPPSIGDMKAIVELHLSGNRFSGMIPKKLGDLQNLKSLDLSNNSFSGTIPLSFSNLISLEYLNLSLNGLSGTIPKSLEKLLYLKGVNVSFNNLEGAIPSDGVFANSTIQSFLGNKDLCGKNIPDVPGCSITGPKRRSSFKRIALKIVTPVVISSFVIFLVVCVWAMRRQKNEKSSNVKTVPEIRSYQLVSYHEIQRATDNFDESNLIDEGGSSSVYKGILSNGTVVAIKVLNLENEEVCKRFDTECEVMRNIRHRNLVPVITTCSSEYIRALILKYMPNGSLEKWLYKEDYHMNLLQRISIMLDVAMAIEYLHHGYGTPIVHCDLKPANVLLDEDMVAHVGDFGISKILAVSKTRMHTETLGTLGYIAPEYGLEGMVSRNGDVYSYGIMLMEVLTKRRPTDEAIDNENLGLRLLIRRAFPRTMMEVVDTNLFNEDEAVTFKSEKSVASMLELALDCTEEKPEYRITMKDVVKRLNKINTTFLGT